MHASLLQYLKILYAILGIGAALFAYVLFLGPELKRSLQNMFNGLCMTLIHFVTVSIIVIFWAPLLLAYWYLRKRNNVHHAPQYL